jgi:hypothetical protein
MAKRNKRSHKNKEKREENFFTLLPFLFRKLNETFKYFVTNASNNLRINNEMIMMIMIMIMILMKSRRR